MEQVPVATEDLGSMSGITVLGTPIGLEDYVREKMIRGWKKSEDCGTQSPRCQTSSAPDNSCCRANPRANHSLRTMPPSQSADYARAHDDGIWQVVTTLLDVHELGNPAIAEHVEHAMTHEAHREGCLAELHRQWSTVSGRVLVATHLVRVYGMANDLQTASQPPLVKRT